MAGELQKHGYDSTRALCEAGNVQREIVFNYGLNELILLDIDDTTQYHFPSEERLFTGSGGSLPSNGVITSGAELVGVLDNSYTYITGDTDLQTCLDSIDTAFASISVDDLDIAGDSGTGVVDIGTQTLSFQGTANEIATSVSGTTATFGLPDSVTIQNTLAVGNGGAITAKLKIDAAAGQERAIHWQSAGITRWKLYAEIDAESGGNAGSPLILRAYDDSGSLISEVIEITRASGGAIEFKRPVEIASTITFSGTMGNSTKDPTTDAPTDWVEVVVGATTLYLPGYTA